MRQLPLYGTSPYIRIPKDMTVTAPDSNTGDTGQADERTEQTTVGMPDEGVQDEQAQKIALVNSSTDEELRGANQ